MKLNKDKNSNTDIILNSCSSFFKIKGIRITANKMTYAYLFPKKSFSVVFVESITKDFIVSANTMKYISIHPALLNSIILLIQKIEDLL
jgi:hypothetical protein